MRPNILDQIANSNNSTPVEPTSSNPSILDRIAGAGEAIDLSSPMSVEGSLNPSDQYSFREDNTIDERDALQSEFKGAVNSFRQGMDQTQISNYQGKLDSYQEIIDNNSILEEQLLAAKEAGKIDEDTFRAKMNDIEAKNKDAQSKVSKFEQDIADNKIEIGDEYVSKLYQMKEAAVQAKGGDASLWERIKYTQPSTLGSSASLMGAQLAATFGAGAAEKIFSKLATGAIGGPVGEGLAIASTAATVIGTLAYSRKEEAYSEKGGQLEKNQQMLLEKWMQENPGQEPDERVLRDIRVQSRKGMDRFMEEQMALVAPDALQAILFPGSKILGAFGAGRKLEQSIKSITDYNKYTRAAKHAGKFYANYGSEKFEEGFQYAAGKRQEAQALGLGEYENQGMLKDILSDSKDVASSINWSPVGEAKGDGRYADDKEFQFAEQSGGLMAVMMGGIGTGVSVMKDINRYRETNRDLQASGIANPEDKIFKFNDQIYLKHFENNTIEYLMEGVRNMGQQKDSKGMPLMTQEEVSAESINIKKAFDKYLEVSQHTENISPEGRFGLLRSKEQQEQLAALKTDLFHSSMSLTRHNEAAKIIPTMNNINSLIDKQKELVSNLESTLGADFTIRDIYNINDRLSIANKKLKELEQEKANILATTGLTEETLPGIESIEQSNKDKKYTVDNLNLTEQVQIYQDLLKVKDNKTLKAWYEKRQNRTKEITENLTRSEEAKLDAENAVTDEVAQEQEARVAPIAEQKGMTTLELGKIKLARKEKLKKLGQQASLVDAFLDREVLSDLSESTPVAYQGMQGTLSMHPEENVMMFTDKETGKSYDIQKDELYEYDNAPHEYGITRVRENPVSDIIDIEPTADGIAITIDGKVYTSNKKNPLDAIRRDKDGNITHVDLVDSKGKKIKFKKYADEVAYSILLHVYNQLENEGTRAREEAKQRASEKASKQELEEQKQADAGTDTRESEKVENGISSLEEDIKKAQAELDAEVNNIETEAETKTAETTKSQETNDNLKASRDVITVDESEESNERPDHFEGIFGKAFLKAKSWFKTAAGRDDDRKKPEQRFYRFVDPKNDNIKEGTKLKVITRHNDPDLFKNLHDADAIAYEKEHKEETIYLVIVDKDNKYVHADQDGKVIPKGDHTSMVYATMLTPVGVADLALETREEFAQAHTEVSAVRDALLNTKEQVFIGIVETSEGVRVRQRNDETGQRENNPLVGRLTNNINESGLLELPTIIIGKDGKAAKLDSNEQIVTAGKLYAKDSDLGDFVDLIARKVNEDEANVILTLIAYRIGMEAKPIEMKDVSAEIEKFIHFGVPKAGANEYTLGQTGDSFFIGEQEYTLDTDEESNLIITEVESGEVVPHGVFLNTLKSFLINFKNVSANSKHLEASNKALRDGNIEEFREPILNEETGEIAFRLWPSYQNFLLSSVGNRVPLYGTDIPALGQPRYRNHYLIYNPNELLTQPIKVDEKKTEPDATPTFSTEIKTPEGMAVAPTLTTVRVDLSKLSLDELKNVAKQLRQKAVDARDAEKNGKQTTSPSVLIEFDYQALKAYIAELEKVEPEVKPMIDQRVDISEENSISNGDKIINIETKPFTNEIKDIEEVFMTTDRDPEGRVYINMDPLKDYIVIPNNNMIITDKKTGKDIINKELNKEGSAIFEVMQGRLMIVTKIGNQLIPFYKSSAGTSGKNMGEWYPFFGFTGSWLVKGGVDKATGKMNYSPEIDKVTDLLNKNLVFPDQYISRVTNKATDSKGNVIADFNNYFKVNRLWMKEFRSQTGSDMQYEYKGLKPSTRNESGLVALITGLNTTSLDSSGTKKENKEWLDLITKKITENISKPEEKVVPSPSGRKVFKKSGLGGKIVITPDPVVTKKDIDNSQKQC